MPALEEALKTELQDLLHAEGQLVKALPKMARAAHDQKLKQAFQKHLEETKGHVERLKEAFDALGLKAKATPCKGMQGLIEEGQERIEEGQDMNEAVADLSLVSAAQRVEHYEIAGYGNARTIADQLGNKKVAKLLAQTLAEEEKTDKLLTQLSPPLLEQASREPSEEEGQEEAPRGRRASAGRG
jgi:Mn-containing catalase